MENIWKIQGKVGKYRENCEGIYKELFSLS